MTIFMTTFFCNETPLYYKGVLPITFANIDKKAAFILFADKIELYLFLVYWILEMLVYHFIVMIDFWNNFNNRETICHEKVYRTSISKTKY